MSDDTDYVTRADQQRTFRRIVATQVFVVIFVLVAAFFMQNIYSKLEDLVSQVQGQCLSRQQAREVSRRLFEDALGHPLNPTDEKLLQQLPPLECS